MLNFKKLFKPKEVRKPKWARYNLVFNKGKVITYRNGKIFTGSISFWQNENKL